MKQLWYRLPAGVWEEALPLGNGRMGAMVFGNIESERIQVNEESIWYGGKKDRINPDAREYLPEVKKLIREGKISAAQELMGTVLTGCPCSENPYQTLGDLKLYFCYNGVKKEGAESPDMAKSVIHPKEHLYRRSLDLSRAVCEVTYEIENVKYRREYFVSKPADCMIIRLTASEKGMISFTLKQERGHFFKGVKKTWSLDGSHEANGVLLYGRPGEDGNAFVMMTKCAVRGGTRKVLGESLIVENADEAILYFGAATQYRSPDADYDLLEKTLCMHLEQVMEKDYESLLREHEEDYKSFFDRVELHLMPDTDEQPVAEDGKVEETSASREHITGSSSVLWEQDVCTKLPTDERLQRISQGYEDTGLEELLFDYGRYLMIAGSRPDTLPLTLQGLWNKDFNPPWESKYTININLEMNYWPAEICNLSECHIPLFTLLKKMRKDGRRVAREMYGCRGIVAHHNTDIHGDCAPQDLWLPATYWPMGIAWLCTHLWTHYQYTMDRKFLKEAFPIMAESALYFVDALEPWGEYLVTNPSCSPENTYILPSGDRGCVCFGPTMDNQILRDLFAICLDSYEILGQDAEQCEIPDCDSISRLMDQVREMQEKIIPTRIGSDGRVMEWIEEYEELEPGHRHVSQLYGLFPSDQITMDGTPELAKAARKTLEARLSHGGGHTGWSRAWIMNHYAKLWDGEKAHEHIVKMLMQSTYPNLFDKHPPFQIDGNFGATAAIAQMLVQANDRRVVLLPALPKAWKQGSVRGLKLPGDAKIAISWENGRIKECEIVAARDYHTVVEYQGEHRSVNLSEGEKYVFCL